MPPIPGFPRTEAGAELDREIAEFDAAGVGETIYAESGMHRVLPDLPALMAKTQREQDGGAGVPQVGQTMSETGPGEKKPDTLIDIHADDIEERQPGAAVRDEAQYRMRLERLTTWLREFRYEDCIAEAKALIAYRPQEMALRQTLERAQESQDRIIEYEQIGYEARERGDFETAEAAVLKLQEFVPLGYGTDVLKEIRAERDKLGALITEVEAHAAAGRFDAAGKRLDELIAEHPAFTPLQRLRDRFSATRPLREELNAAMARRDYQAARHVTSKLLQVVPEDRAARAAMASIEQAAVIDKHDKLIEEARAALRGGRTARAVELANLAKKVIPGSARVKEVLAGVEGRGRSRKRMYTAVVAVVAVAIIVAGAMAVMSAMQDNLRQAALDKPAGEERVNALTEYIASYPADGAAQAALKEADAEWRRIWMDAAKSESRITIRRESLEAFLQRWPDDAAAIRFLDETKTAEAEAAQRGRDRLALRALLDKYKSQPAERLAALKTYAAEHPENMAVLGEIDRARLEVARAGFDAAVAGERDLFNRWKLIDARYRELENEAAADWQEFRGDVRSLLERTRGALEQEARTQSRVLPDRTAAEAWLQRIGQLVAADPGFARSLQPEIAQVRQIIEQDNAADELLKRAATIDTWFDAAAFLPEMRQFALRVPRLDSRVRPTIDRISRLAAQKPPDVRGFGFLRQQSCTGPAGTVIINMYRCEAMAEALRMPAIPDSLRERIDEKGPWTRIDIEFALLPQSGTERASFRMGSPDNEPGHSTNEQQHDVTLTRPYLIARTEVSQEVWEAVRKRVKERGIDLTPNPSGFQAGDNPVERIRWSNADEFCTALGLRLPTEAEWEFACRAGTSGPFAYGDSISAAQVNFDARKPWPGQPDGTFRGRTSPVGTLPPNGFGLYEMHGNVMEWCADWFGRFGSAQETDPVGPRSDVVARVLKGGNWRSSATNARSAYRTGAGPESSTNYVGFRPAASIDQ
ncbi:MAG: SUMF1/EgtB/PvdO family nonheme iron enzyme [Planctomycetota bacterium]